VQHLVRRLTSAEPEAIKGIDSLLHEIQHDLFDLGGELCIPGYEQLQAHHVLRLDEALALHNANLPRLAEFILPGGSSCAAQAHVCRAVCRRAERAVVALAAAETVRPLAQQYLNRLSDLLFCTCPCTQSTSRRARCVVGQKTLSGLKHKAPRLNSIGKLLQHLRGIIPTDTAIGNASVRRSRACPGQGLADPLANDSRSSPHDARITFGDLSGNVSEHWDLVFGLLLTVYRGLHQSSSDRLAPRWQPL
jgi:ATP:cob(I)alamin adenosyltransferase